ncbi:MAG: hypothetical protein U1F68_02020 [Gammaproteobacteria bacterium]
MPKPRGRHLPLSLPRRFVADAMHFALQTPTVMVERRMELAELRAARQRCAPRPSWCALFVRALALVATRQPELRRAYLLFPLPHLYEHPHSIATVPIARSYLGEDALFPALLDSPETSSVAQISAQLRRHKQAPLVEISSYRHVLRLMRTPWPARRWLWWLGLNVSGWQRARYFGTFVVTSPAENGVGSAMLRAFHTAALHYSLFDEADRLTVRLSFDHRVFDGVGAGRILVDLERTLRGALLEELRAAIDPSQAHTVSHRQRGHP